jgi:thymidylate kinase
MTIIIRNDGEGEAKLIRRLRRIYPSIVVEGNDGVGKSTIIRRLSRLYPQIQFEDRGELTKMTDNPSVKLNPKKKYMLLECSPITSLLRIKYEGKDLEEYYHRPEVLEYYYSRFSILAKQLNIPIFSTECDIETTLENISNYMNNNK